MRLFYSILFSIILIKLSDNCRFARTFYQKHSNIFQLNENQTSLTIQPLYALSNQSFSIGIIYRLADTYLVPVPLVFQCPQNQRISSPIDCEFTIVDTRSDLSIRKTESTRITTVPLHFQEYSSISIRGAYFKQSTVTLRNCRLNNEEFLSDLFHLHIQFEQTIDSPCQNTCIHPQLYQCSSISNTCQCRLHEITIEKSDHLCIDTELSSNCSITPERCRRLCHISNQIQTGKIDHNCQCPLGTQRILSNNIYHCNLPILSECNDDRLSTTCPNGFICRQKQCIKLKIFNQMILLLLICAFLIIIILIIIILKMRSIRCVKFIHSDFLSTHSSSSCSTLSSSSKSTNKICEKYTKINLFE